MLTLGHVHYTAQFSICFGAGVCCLSLSVGLGEGHSCCQAWYKLKALCEQEAVPGKQIMCLKKKKM